MSRPVVAVVKTRPETVIADYARVMTLAGFQSALPKTNPTLLKINISWHFWYPACSSPPWQVAGVIDLAKERKRLSKDLERLAAELKRCESQLANDSFLSRAPAAEVDKIRERQREAQSQSAALSDTLRHLGG